MPTTNHSSKICGDPEDLTFTTIFKKCCGNTCLGRQEHYILKIQLEFPYDMLGYVNMKCNIISVDMSVLKYEQNQNKMHASSVIKATKTDTLCCQNTHTLTHINQDYWTFSSWEPDERHQHMCL